VTGWTTQSHGCSGHPNLSPMDRRQRPVLLASASRRDMPLVRLDEPTSIVGNILDEQHAQVGQGIGNPHDVL
jgi:hypothetical protein